MGLNTRTHLITSPTATTTYLQTDEASGGTTSGSFDAAGRLLKRISPRRERMYSRTLSVRPIRRFLTILPPLTACLLTSCGKSGPSPQNAAQGPKIIRASAPQGFSLSHLGRPHDQNFQLLGGKHGRPLFKEAQTFSSQQERLSTSFVKVDDAEHFAAHASAWQLGSARTHLSNNHRYVSRRLILVHDVVELDETDGARRAPKEAVYFPFRVYRGWSYEVVCNVRNKKLGADFEEDFLVAEGGVEAFASDHQLDCTSIGLGIQADSSKSIFADKIEEVDKNFRASSPVPVLVEWRRISGRSGHRRKREPLEPHCAGHPGCQPCSKWAFSRLIWTLADRKPGGASWDADDSPPDVSVTLTTEDGLSLTSDELETFDVKWTFRSALELDAGTKLTLKGTDLDVDRNDSILTLESTVPRYLEDGGTWDLGAGQVWLQGNCKRPE